MFQASNILGTGIGMATTGLIGVLVVAFLFASYYLVFKPKQGISTLSIDTHPVPGRKCPSCLAKGETVWVIPGKCCPQCGTAVN